jgi:hypothetical protein
MKSNYVTERARGNRKDKEKIMEVIATATTDT